MLGLLIVAHCNVKLAHSSILTIRDNAARIKERAPSENKVFVWRDYHSTIRMDCTKTV
jgi:hypothetical protein